MDGLSIPLLVDRLTAMSGIHLSTEVTARLENGGVITLAGIFTLFCFILFYFTIIFTFTFTFTFIFIDTSKMWCLLHLVLGTFTQCPTKKVFPLLACILALISHPFSFSPLPLNLSLSPHSLPHRCGTLPPSKHASSRRGEAATHCRRAKVQNGSQRQTRRSRDPHTLGDTTRSGIFLFYK